jgi:pimeloyl-ACP methyl ester carboxylesterase
VKRTRKADKKRSPAVGQPTHDALAGIARDPVDDLDLAIESDVAARRIWASPSWFDEDDTRAYFRQANERAFHPGASLRQLMAIADSPDREPLLAQPDLPTLVIHGTLDPLVTPDGGQRTAELVPGAELLMIEGMAHDLPVQAWQQIISAITVLASRSVG